MPRSALTTTERMPIVTDAKKLRITDEAKFTLSSGDIENFGSMTPVWSAVPSLDARAPFMLPLKSRRGGIMTMSPGRATVKLPFIPSNTFPATSSMSAQSSKTESP